MAINRGVFGNSQNFEDRFKPDYEELASFVEHCKGLGLKIVLTAGSFDLIHIGHATYLEKARSLGDLLVVGVDSDNKMRTSKGPTRPVVSQDERMRMLTHLRSVDVVTLKEHGTPHLHLLKTVRPHVLVVSKSTKGGYSPKEKKERLKFCEEVVELEPMSTTSTSARIRMLNIGGAEKIAEALQKKIPETVAEVLAELKGVSK